MVAGSDSSIQTDYSEAAGAPVSFGKLGPAQKIGVLKQLKSKPAQVRRFIKDNTQRNLMKQIRGSLPSVVSALNCYLKFSRLVAEDPFPVTERRVLDWSSVFNDTGTYRDYTQHMQKVFFFPRHVHGLVHAGCFAHG